MKGTLTTQQMKQLFREGFVGREVKAYNLSKTPSGEIQQFQFNSQTFIAARQSRMAWFDGLLKAGWSEAEVRGKVNTYYSARGKATPYDWLKLEYQKGKQVAAFLEALRRKIRARATRILGYSYGRKLRKRPYKRPIRPQLPIRRKMG